jgi:dynein heavy chain 1
MSDLTLTIGLLMEGASWANDCLAVNAGETMKLESTCLRWVQADQSDSSQKAYLNLPVYLNEDRSDVLFTVDLPFEGDSGSMFSLRAVCLTAGG